jgi:uncharacterized membrane protein
MKKSWIRTIGISVGVSAAGFLFSLLWPAGAVSLLLALFILGAVAGFWAAHQGWLCGTLVGLPVVLFHMTRLAAREHEGLVQALAQPDYWRVLMPACVVSTGMAIMGGLLGAWIQDIRWDRGR